MVDLRKPWDRRGYYIAFLAIAMSTFFVTRGIILEQQRLFRRSMFDDADDAEENLTATQLIMAHLESYVKEMNYLSKVKTVIETTNAAETVINDNLYNGLHDDNVVIVIRVNRDYSEFYHMLKSLSNVFGYSKIFIIFIHECNESYMNSLVKSNVYVKYMQFYYPFASEMFPRYYPGQDDNFCGVGYNCIANDSRRNASLVEEKHLWWWTVNKVFSLDVMKNYTKHVIFVDEHSYFGDDLVYLKRMMEMAVDVYCPECMMMNFGGHPPSVLNYDLHEAYVTVEPFGSSNNTNGISFNRSTWNKIKSLKKYYCNHNDYSWKESLKNLISHAEKTFLVFTSVGSRIFDTSKCEATSHDVVCDIDGKKKNMSTFIQSVKRGFFPQNLRLVPKEAENVTVLQRGGWEDIRDIDLCLYMTTKPKNKVFKF